MDSDGSLDMMCKEDAGIMQGYRMRMFIFHRDKCMSIEQVKLVGMSIMKAL